MRQSAARTGSPRPRRSTAAGLAVVAAVIVGTLVLQTAPSSAPSLDDVLRGGPGGLTIDGDGAVTEADGRVPEGVTPFDDRYPGVTGLDPALLQALRAAATAAAEHGIEVEVNSGWRSREYQDQLLDEAVETYGSEEEAARWAATAHTSPHVSGDAVDLGPPEARAWLSEHGSSYGLCQIYENEPWHFELRPQALDGGCSSTYPDPTHDPRMQR